MNRSIVAAVGGAIGTLALVGAFAGGYALGSGHTRTAPPVHTVTVTVSPSTSAPGANDTLPTAAASQPTRYSVQPTTAPTPLAVIYTCTHGAVSAPSSFVLACADYGITLSGLKWSAWGAVTTHANGNLEETNCTPDCADGHEVLYPASVTVTSLVGNRYTWMSVQAPQAPGGPYDYTLTTTGPS